MENNGRKWLAIIDSCYTRATVFSYVSRIIHYVINICRLQLHDLTENGPVFNFTNEDYVSSSLNLTAKDS